ncbi:MAG: hypothetical protein U0165_18170 [Polyangiaceae bacterium]
MGSSQLTLVGRCRAAASSALVTDRSPWQVDVVRGERARVGSLSLDSASRAFDRADASWTVGSASWLFSSGLRAMAARGASGWAVGPHLAVARSIAFGPTVMGAAVNTSVVTNDSSPMSAIRADTDLSSRFWLSSLRVDVAARGTETLLVHEASSMNDLSSDARASLSWPVFRAFSSGAVHLLSPSISMTSLVANVRSDGSAEQLASWSRLGRYSLPSSGSLAMPAIGLESRVATSTGRGWTTFASLGASVTNERSRPMARARNHLGLGWVDLSSDIITSRVTSFGVASIDSIEVRPLRRLSVGSDLTALHGLEPIEARWLSTGSVMPVGSASWLAREGVSAGAFVRVALSDRLSASGRMDRDMTERVWIGERAELRYADRCGCIALSMVVAHRLGREGVDAMLGLDLAPR